MGQQQLILLVLATVIVGIAIVVGIRAFTENSIKANSDAMVQDIVRIASDVQAWKQKPAPFGGQLDAADPGGTADKYDPKDFQDVDWVKIGYGNNATTYTNLNGTYTMAGSATGLQICGYSEQKGNTVQINVTGLRDSDIIQATGGIVLGTATAAASCTAPS
jgi:hypothetical protein